MNHILYLASKSASRKKLLERAGIVFEMIGQDADESKCDWNQELQKVVESIALHKMEHVIMPHGTEGQIAFVLTADTLGIDPTGAIRGKPADKNEAIMMLQMARQGVNECGTAFCLDKKIFNKESWVTHKRIQGYAQAKYFFEVPDGQIEDYIKRSLALEGAGAIKIEDGSQFVKSINGSYTAIIGLPMFELWQALHEVEFF